MSGGQGVAQRLIMAGNLLYPRQCLWFSIAEVIEYDTPRDLPPEVVRKYDCQYSRRRPLPKSCCFLSSVVLLVRWQASLWQKLKDSQLMLQLERLAQKLSFYWWL